MALTEDQVDESKKMEIAKSVSEPSFKNGRCANKTPFDLFDTENLVTT
jgi:hypothetical protein